MIVILMGAAGAGKTTVGRALALATGWPFHDADDLHPAANVDKISRGIPLDDEDRAPWLRQVHAMLVRLSGDGISAVVACSALRVQYRATLGDGVGDLRWVFLRADERLLAQRLARRTGHFAGPTILPAQLADLEPPGGADALTVAADQPVAQLVARICAGLRLPCAR